ncbi:hypothetical protein [Sphingosinithalassobacter portus]|uniref:hypothetical protein n=1 Tax=Stakelama portus TaxID=2676234 RepID=UPI000D6E1309|nr:hypothetical protein [Sphingosinithalassobacter portus]
MLGAPKPTASLSSGLLARKGQARPAMRPQGYVGLTPLSAQDDLGWNDMGEDSGTAAAPIDGLTPAPAPAPAPVAPAPVATPPVAKPEVLRQREALDQEIREAAARESDEQSPAIAPDAAARIAREIHRKKRRAAFTLRLDSDRHLRLRLASAVTNRSAQQIVTEALDAFLDSQQAVDALVHQLERQPRRKDR